MAVENLGSPVLAYGNVDREELVVIEREDRRALMSGGVEAVRPDGRDGVLFRTAEGAIEWLPDPGIFYFSGTTHVAATPVAVSFYRE